MRDYDRIYERVVHRGDEILEQRRIKAVKIKRTSYAVSGMCAAVIAGVGIWKMTDIKNLPDNNFSEITDIVEPVVTTAPETAVITSSTTAAKAVTSAKNSSTATTAKTSASTTVSENITTSALSEVQTETASESEIKTSETVTNIQTQTVSDNVKAQTESHTDTTSSVTTTTKDESNIETHSNSNTTSLITQLKTTSADVAIITNQCSVEIVQTEYTHIFRNIIPPVNESYEPDRKQHSYEYNYTEINAADVISPIDSVYLTSRIFNGTAYEEMSVIARLYKVNGYSEDVLAAVRFDGDDKYYCYINTLFKPESMKEFLSAYNITINDIGDSCRYNNSSRPIEKAKLWEYITAETEMLNVTEYCENNKIEPWKRLVFTFDTKNEIPLSGTLSIDPKGYIWTNINNNQQCFRIGVETAMDMIFDFTE